MKRVVVGAFAAAVSLFAQPAPRAQPGPAGLWASLSFSQPLFQEGRTEHLMLSFAAVNDGTSTIDPEIRESRVFINYVEWTGWRWTSMNGPRDADTVHGVRPGGFLMCTCALGELFSKPGTYTLRWEGELFRPQNTTLRVLPRLR